MLHSRNFSPRPSRRQPGATPTGRGRLSPWEGHFGNMNDYEVLLMIDPELPEERGGEIITRVRELAAGDGGRWDGHEPWGRRKLAYEIHHKTDGVYPLLLFASTPATLS